MQSTQYKPTGAELPADHNWDLRDWSSTAYPNGSLYPVVFGDDRPNAPVSDACILGGTVVGQQARTLSWDAMKATYDGAGLRVVTPDSFLVQGFRATNVEDAIDPRPAAETTGGAFVIRDTYLEYVRDDCIENDKTMTGSVSDVLFDGCYTFYSEQDSPERTGSADLVTFDRVLARLQAMPQPNQGPPGSTGHGQLFKLKGGNYNHFAIRDSVFLVEDEPARYAGGCNDEWLTRSTVRNSTIVWAGSGPFPCSVPSGMRVTTDRGVWERAKADWLSRHGCTGFASCTKLTSPAPPT